MDRLQYRQLVMAQLGDAYRLGAEALISDSNPDVFDCSELVEWSYGRAGVRIRDGAWAQYEDTNAVVGLPQIGDLTFLANNPDRPHDIGHVGIITSVNSKTGEAFIVEAKGREYGVVLSTLSDWKRRSSFAGVRRFSPFTLKVLYPAVFYKKVLIHTTAGELPEYERLADSNSDFIKAEATTKDSWREW